MRLVTAFRAALLSVSVGCASSPAPVAKAPPPPTDTIEATESAALVAERHINAAEKDLDALRPDPAEESLKNAARALSDPKVDGHPDVKFLRTRHEELETRLPAVRAEVRKRELAAAVAAAREKIDAAQVEMKAAVGEIKKPAPEDSELKRAEDSVAAVRTALEAHTELEDKDLEYAKYALSVRKTLPEQKKLVEQRRLELALGAARDDINRANSDLAGVLARLKNRDVPDADFDEAKKLAEAVDKAIEKAGPLVPRDAKFAIWVNATKQRLAQTKTSIEQRSIQVRVERQRARIEGGRKVLADALTALKPAGVVEAAFTEAETAAKALDDMLKEGEPLKSKDRAYASYAVQVALRIKEANTRIQTRRLEVEVAAQKKAIAGKKTAIEQVMRRLQAKRPVDGEFEEARNQTGELEKLLEGAKAVAEKDPAFRKQVGDEQAYVNTTRKAIDARKLEVEVDEQRGRVAAALAALNKSTRRLGNETDVEGAELAVKELGMVVDSGEQYASKNAAYAKYAVDARRAIADANKQIKVRRDELEMEAQETRVKLALENMRATVEALSAYAPSEVEFKNASNAALEAKKVIDGGDAIEKKLAKYRTFADGARKTVAAAQQKIEKRQIEIAVRERKTAIQEALATAKSGVTEAKKGDATSDSIKIAKTGLDLAEEEAKRGAALEKQDAGFATYASGIREQLAKMKDELEEAKSAVAFREGPIAALSAGIVLAETGNAELAPAERQKAFKSALERFVTCRKDGASLLADRPRLASAPFVVENKKTTGAKLLTLCGDRAKAAEAKLSAANATMAFYDGPGKSFGRGQALLATAKSTSDSGAKKKAFGEALAHFESCLESGRMLQYKHPELNKAQFEVDGQKVTLPNVVTTCQKEAKSLRSGNKEN